MQAASGKARFRIERKAGFIELTIDNANQGLNASKKHGNDSVVIDGFAAALPLPLGEVPALPAERANGQFRSPELPKRIRLFTALSVSFADSSPRGRAKGVTPICAIVYTMSESLRYWY